MSRKGTTFKLSFYNIAFVQSLLKENLLVLKLAGVFCMICPQFTHKTQEMPLQKKVARTEKSEGTSQLKQQDYALRA